ncbi:lysin B [Gordonia phage Commandaria]|uniref:Lysin B n=1 Tax=Gordonia phage Commandaria TaxID=3038364 RepID=A0AAF0GG86_9CAUD|nr:lysin B [Gordonia phage Commandaria]WGH20803.1 lysin B [Gordonia phage Commandaria]
MTNIVLRTLRGTGEPLEGGMLGDIVEACERMGVRHRPVQYHASIAPVGGTKMFHESYHDGWHRGAVADAEGIPSVWAAYSLGALIAGDLAAAGQLSNCIGLILLSDPNRHSKQIAPECRVNPAYYGCVDRRFIRAGYPVWQISVADDPISACSPTNGFRMLAAAVAGRPQPPFHPGFLNIGETLSAVRRYLGTPPVGNTPARPSRHVVYSTERMPGAQHITYTKFAAMKAEEAIINYRKEIP